MRSDFFLIVFIAPFAEIFFGERGTVFDFDGEAQQGGAGNRIGRGEAV